MTSLPMLMQAVKKCLVAGSHRSRLVQDNHIKTFKVRTMVPKRFPDDPLQPVAADCGPAVFFGNRHTEPCFLLAIFFVKNRKHLVAAAFCLLEDVAVGGSIKKPAVPSETAPRHRACCWKFFRWIRGRGYSVLRRELRSSLRAPSLQHKTARLGRHARSKTMRACPLQITGLECAFHVTEPCV